jgi:hypothetical protein
MPLLKIIPSYLYWQYSDDEDLQSFVTAYNALAQEYLNSFNELNMPIYTIQNGALLDWLATGIYGYSRPTIANQLFVAKGAYNTIDYNFETIPYNAEQSVPIVGSSEIATDDIYQRCLTWNFYKGDGFQFSIPWLKRRVLRFLQGVNGFAPDIQETYAISVTFPMEYKCLITISKSSRIDTATVLQNAINTKAINLPFQYDFQVVSV